MARKRLAQYELIESLGRGMFGEVFLAEDLSLGRRVALKVLHPQMSVDPQFVEGFEAEARLLVQLNHPNIVHLYQFGEVDGRYFIVMPYLSGGTLTQRLTQDGRFSFEQAQTLMVQVCGGLQKMHAQGYLHRDLTPHAEYNVRERRFPSASAVTLVLPRWSLSR
ncbi:MAG: hypothetical protein OHK0052_12700 [Anaerolineales bacterium]